MSRIYLVLLLTLLSVTIAAEFEHIGLSGYMIRELRLYDNYLYAATDNGIYSKNINEQDTLWTHLGLEDQLILSLAVINHNSIVAGCTNNFGSSAESPVYRTDDGGDNWYCYSAGIEYDSLFQTFSLDTHPGLPGVVLSTDASSVSRITDDDPVWELLWGQWNSIGYGVHFIRFHPENPDIIWGGGESGMHAAFLLRSYDGGNTWDETILWYLVGGDNACHIIAFDPHDGQIIYAGMEGRIIKTSDGGDNWSVILDGAADEEIPWFDVWGLAVSEHDNQIVYSSCFQRNIYEELLLFISEDGGETWAEVNGGMGRRGTLSFAYRSIDKGDEIYLGTTGDGVFRFTNGIGEVSLEETSLPAYESITLENYPNPLNDRTIIKFSIPDKSAVSISLYSVRGERIATLLSGSFVEGEYAIYWDGKDTQGNTLPSGIYFALLQTEESKRVNKMLLLK